MTVNVRGKAAGNTTLRAVPKIQTLSMSRTFLAHVEHLSNPGV